MVPRPMATLLTLPRPTVAHPATVAMAAPSQDTNLDTAHPTPMEPELVLATVLVLVLVLATVLARDMEPARATARVRAVQLDMATALVLALDMERELATVPAPVLVEDMVLVLALVVGLVSNLPLATVPALVMALARVLGPLAMVLVVLVMRVEQAQATA